MYDQLRPLIIGSSLVLGACESERDLDLDLDQPALDQPTAHGSIDEVGAASEAGFRALEGLDVDCVDVKAPIIVRIDPFATACKFNGFEGSFGTKWETVSLFDEGSPMLQSLASALPTNSPLRQFCRYDYIGGASDPYTDYAEFINYLRGPNQPNGVDGDSAAIDCPVIAPMTGDGTGDGADEGLNTADGRAALHRAFMTNLHAIPAGDLENVTRRPTRLVLLDTVAEGVAPYNEHGLQLEQLIADIACPGDPATCMDWIEHVLVMPRVPEDDYASADWSGGNVGYMHEFSMGLAFALLDWADTNLALPLEQRERLVLSAALGADPNHPIASDPQYAPAQSAIVALQAAYCMGAVVYAAAGNTRDNSCPNAETQMLAPASYETFVVPTPSQCSSWGYLADNPSHTYLNGSPLIHAVGGLDGSDQPIANHRREAHPRLHATASDAISSEGTVKLTGTSVATAAAAGAHLLRWSIEPDESGSSVARRLYNTGYAIGQNADSGKYVGLPIRRLGICQALADLLPLQCEDPAPDPHGNLADYALTVEDAIADADLAGLLWQPLNKALTGSQPDCSGGPVFDVFVKPQPERPTCSNCSGTLNGGNGGGGNNHMLNMSIANEEWKADLVVTSAYLHTYNPVGMSTTFDLADVVDDINLADPTIVIQVPFEVPGPVAAVLEFVYFNADDGRYTSQSNTIPLLLPM